MKEIFIQTENQISTIVLVENGNLIEKYEEDNSKKRLEGKIYIGVVENVLQGMQAAFVNIGEGKNTFMHLKDILPKVNLLKNQENVKNQNIKNVVKVGDKILIQVKRDATSIKGAKVSTHMNIPSRYFVLMPYVDIRTVSQKIEKKEERERLTKIVENIIPEDMGVIVRTSAVGKSKEELEDNLKAAIDFWNNLEKKIKENINKAPVMIFEGKSFLEKLLMDLVDQKVLKITVNTNEDYEKVTKILKKFKESEIKVELRENENILKTYDIDEQIEQTKKRKIWLKCGGFITIDKTEALTAIDVNSGKYTGSKDLEQTVFKVNKEATLEIANQLRLRDIGGIIIIDYIDMEEEEHRKQIIEMLEECFKKDRSKTQVVGFSKLNLLEMTRKHMKGGE